MGNNINHLLVITPGFPESEADTTCLPFVQQMMLCYQRKFPACIISIISLQYPYSARAYIWHGMQVYGMGGANKKGLWKLLLYQKAIHKGRQIHRTVPINAILSLCLSETSLIAKWLSEKSKIPFAIWMFGQDAKKGNKYFKLVKPNFDQLLPISAYQSDVLYKFYGFRASTIVHNGINQAIFPALSATTRKIDMLAAGSLISLKQYELFIRLVAHIKQNGYYKVKAVIIGAGPEEQKLKTLSTTLDLNENIRFVGPLDHASTLSMMNEARLFIHPSSYEGHSTVMLEALYMGCDVVSFIPAADQPVSENHICIDWEEMKETTLHLMNTKQDYKQVIPYNMEDSAAQLQQVLHSMITS